METQPPSAPPPTARKTSGMAITSLVFGVLSILCLGVCGTIPAVIFGIIALSRIKSSGGAVAGSGLALAGIITGCIGILSTLVIAGMVFPALNAAREKARQQLCKANLMQLNAAYIMYAGDHDGVKPAKLDDLKSYLIVGGNQAMPRVFLCPSAKDTNSPSYEIVIVSEAERDSSTAVVILEKEGNHPAGVRFRAFADGHVDSVGHSH